LGIGADASAKADVATSAIISMIWMASYRAQLYTGRGYNMTIQWPGFKVLYNDLE
jgi:hypothetical protein